MNGSTQIKLDESDQAPRSDRGDGLWSIADDLAYLRLSIVNVVFFGRPGASDRGWTLIDAGLSTSRGDIEECARRRFGDGARPSAIVLTHGHFDHVGSVEKLAEVWNCPVFAHTLEHPYLDGSASYPPPDPWVGGAVALMSPLFPRSPVDLGGRLQPLPSDGSVPGMPGWRWVHTPGHTPGHVSLWRGTDGAIIAGDAFITTAQESAYSVAVQELEMHGPPRYFTPDWGAAQESVEKIAALRPRLAITGHGRPAAGPGMLSALERLAREFAAIAVPSDGKYVDQPATAAEGSVYRRP